jgi:hypothetical protein
MTVKIIHDLNNDVGAGSQICSIINHDFNKPALSPGYISIPGCICLWVLGFVPQPNLRICPQMNNDVGAGSQICSNINQHINKPALSSGYISILRCICLWVLGFVPQPNLRICPQMNTDVGAGSQICSMINRDFNKPALSPGYISILGCICPQMNTDEHRCRYGFTNIVVNYDVSVRYDGNTFFVFPQILSPSNAPY